MSKWFRKYYKTPHTRNEARQNQEGWCRPKRRPAHLADSWDDRPRCIQNTWKVKRNKQYHTGGRGKKHTLILDRNVKEWILQEYFEEHNIPYRIEDVKQSYMRRWPIRRRVVVGQRPYYIKKYIWAGRKLKTIETHQIGYEDIFEWKTIRYEDKPISYTVGYRITWWSDKDIGLEHIIKKM